MKKQELKQLETPIGIVLITDGNKTIPFTISKNIITLTYEVYEKFTVPTGKYLHTETSYKIIINTNDLDFGRDFKIMFTPGKLEFQSSDEANEALVITKDGWTLGLGMYDPNDKEMNRQLLFHYKRCQQNATREEPFEYDITKFRRYCVERSEDDSGFTFRLLDRSEENIIFYVAWIKHDGVDASYYEDAIGFWLT